MKRHNGYYLILILLIVAYTLFVIKTPYATDNTTTQNQLDSSQSRVISLTILVPYALIWLSAFIGFIRTKHYANLVKSSTDGRALKTLSNGLMLLAISLPLNALASTIRNYINSQHYSLTPTTTIIYNYLSLVLTLAGVWLVADGARRLAATVEKKSSDYGHIIMACIFTAFCILFTYITMTDPARRIPGGISGTAAYYLPDFLVFSTIVVPYIVLWYLGFRAAYHIRLYSRNVTGLLYKRALGYLSAGIAFVVLSLMVLRLTSSMSAFLSDLSLQLLLIFVYVLLIIIGIGYGLIAAGAKRLQKIEEV